MRSLLLIVGLLLPPGIASAGPFFMFDATTFSSPSEATAVTGVLVRHFTAQDYIAVAWRQLSPALAARIGVPHTFAAPASLAAVQQDTTNPQIGLVLYDIEHWSATPAQEQADPIGSILSAAQIVASQPGRSFGITPDGQFIGITSGACSVNEAQNIVRNSGLDFTRLNLMLFQAQGLLSDTCALGNAGISLYTSYVSQNAGFVKAKNSKVLVVAQLSFRDSPPARMIAAMAALAGTVDGFYLAYPEGAGQVACTYCSPQNLEQVLSTTRRPKGRPRWRP
jgi:hypothetical protein